MKLFDAVRSWRKETWIEVAIGVLAVLVVMVWLRRRRARLRAAYSSNIP